MKDCKTGTIDTGACQEPYEMGKRTSILNNRRLG